MLSFLRVFIPSNARLSDGSRLSPVPMHFSCRGDFLFLSAGRHQMKLRANVSKVSRGDSQQIISARGKKLTRTFDQDGQVVDFILPPELLSIVRRVVTLRRNIGVALSFRPLPFIGADSAMEPSADEFVGAALTTGRDVDRAARFELIEV